MEEAWEKAVEAARAGQGGLGEDPSETRTLTLDGALKCAQGRLPPRSLLEPFSQLRHLSIANVGLASLADFPRLPHLERLILSDNRIAGGLQHLIQAGLDSLRDLDLSNNKIQLLEDLAPLAQLKLVSLDLYECPVTRISDYRKKVFSMINSLEYLDKVDAEDNERPESDEEEEDELDEEDVDDASGDGVEVDGEEIEGEMKGHAPNVHEEEEDSSEEDEERDEEAEDNEELDEEEDEGGSYQEAVVAVDQEETFEEDDDDGENVEVHDIEESDEDEGREDNGEAEEDDDDDEDDEEEDDGGEYAAQVVASAEGELDVVERDSEEEENGELGEEDEIEEEEEGFEGADNVEVDAPEDEDDDEEDDEEEHEDYGTEYLIQAPDGHTEDDEGASDFEPGENEDDDEDFDDDEDEEEDAVPSLKKRSREEEAGKDERPKKR